MNTSELVDNFIKSTYDPELFHIVDVEGDNKCFYRSAIMSMLSNINNLDKIKSSYQLVMKKVFNQFNTLESINKNAYSEDFYDEGIYNLETRIISWISKNQNETKNPVGLSIAEIVEMTHEMSISNYIRHDILEEPIWGGLPEQIALANIYRMPIYIFQASTLNKKTYRFNEGIIRGNKANKNTRLKLAQIINPNLTSGNRAIYLLWKHYSSGDDHYMALIPKTPAIGIDSNL